MKISQQITFVLLTILACSLAPVLSAQIDPAPLTETEIANAQLQADVTELVRQAREANPDLDLSDPVAVQQAIEALMAESYLLVPLPTAAEIQIIAETVMIAFMLEIQATPGIDVNAAIANVSSAILTATVAGLEAAAAAAPEGSSTTSVTAAIAAASTGIVSGAVAGLPAGSSSESITTTITAASTGAVTGAVTAKPQAAAHLQLTQLKPLPTAQSQVQSLQPQAAPHLQMTQLKPLPAVRSREQAQQSKQQKKQPRTKTMTTRARTMTTKARTMTTKARTARTATTMARTATRLTRWPKQCKRQRPARLKRRSIQPATTSRTRLRR